MTPAETIAAAIEKLEEIKYEQRYDAPWVVDAEGQSDVGIWAGVDGDRILVAGERFDAETVVLLNRTIDAQLAILRTGLRLTIAFPESEWTNTVVLARSIIGEVA